MADQDAQDINQMMSASSEVTAPAPKKSKLLWIVLGCVILGVGLGIFVYQQSIKPAAKPSPTPKTVPTSPKPSPLASAVTPGVSLVEAQPKTVAFPKAGQLRVYYRYFPAPASWNPLGIIVKEGAGGDSFTAPGGAVSTQAQIVDTGYVLTGPATLTIDSYLGSNSSQLSIGWATPAGNTCGFNGFGTIEYSPLMAWVTEQAKGEPLVSVQCWGDYSPNPNDTSAKDFNDYILIWSYTPGGAASTSPSPSASASKSPSPSPSSSSLASSSPSPSPSRSPSPSPSRAASPSPSTASTTVTPTPSARAAMPDTSGGTPVTGVFEVTVASVSVGLILLVLGLLGLLAL